MTNLSSQKNTEWHDNDNRFVTPNDRLFDRILILTLPVFKNVIYRIMEKYCDGLTYQFVSTADEFKNTLSAIQQSKTLLLSFGTGVIVTKEDLSLFKAAYNFHPAPPEYPGLDPHHFAIYEGAKEYGATCHVMTEKIDNGPIVMVRKFLIEERLTAYSLLEKAIFETFDSIDAFLKLIFVENKLPEPLHDVSWKKNMCTRAKLKSLCHIDPSISKEELLKRFHAFQEGVENKNLFIQIHGYSFFCEGEASNAS